MLIGLLEAPLSPSRPQNTVLVMSSGKLMLKKENPVKVKRSRAALPPSPEAKPTRRSRNEKGGDEVRRWRR